MITELKKIDPDIKENLSFKELTTFKIGGPAKHFSVIDDEQLLIKLLKFCKEKEIPYLIIGQGSNLLISDNGFDGLVIKLNFNTIEFKNGSIKVSSDVLLNKLVSGCLNHNLSGLEPMVGIPGTVGGAVVGNAGAYGGEIADVFEKAEVINKYLEKEILKKADMDFSYRDSAIKHDGYVILKIYLKLKKGNKAESIKLINKLTRDRWEKHPHEPSAGSTFKNIFLSDEIINKLKQKNIEVPKQFYEYKKIPVAWIIDKLGLKGFKIGEAQVSEKHANHLINIGNSTADEMVQLISYVKMKARKELGIQLEEEVRYIGF